MKITKDDLGWAASSGLITTEQAEQLWSALERRSPGQPRFNFANVAYYSGALVIILAMALLMGGAWEKLGATALLLISILYALLFGALGGLLWHRTSYRTAGGLLVTVAVCMVPIAVYAVEQATGFWLEDPPSFAWNYRGTHVVFVEWIRASGIFMELATVLAALVAIYFIRFPFLVAPAALALGYMAMDVARLISGPGYRNYEESMSLVLMIYGAAMIATAYVLDHRTKADFSFWAYLFGLAAFWGGLTEQTFSGPEPASRALYYLLFSLVLILLSIFLERRVFVVFGGLGVLIYLGYLAYDVFEGSLILPFALTAVGLAVIALGVLYQRYAARASTRMADSLPERLKWLKPQNRVIGSAAASAPAEAIKA